MTVLGECINLRYAGFCSDSDSSDSDSYIYIVSNSDSDSDSVSPCFQLRFGFMMAKLVSKLFKIWWFLPWQWK